MRKTTIIALFSILVIALFALSGLIFAFLWNLVMPSVFHAPSLSWGAGVVIVLLLSFVGSAFK